MKGLKIIAIIMALVTCVSVLSACGNNEEIAFDVSQDDNTQSGTQEQDGADDEEHLRLLNGIPLEEYTVIYDAQDVDYSKRAATYIRDQIEDRTSVRLTLCEDGKGEFEHEIIVGETSRDISKSLHAPTDSTQFAIYADNDHIAMEGNYFVIAAAAYFFVETYITGEYFDASVPRQVSIHEPIVKEAKNFVLLIGDGMGLYQTLIYDMIDISRSAGKEYGDGEDIFYGYLLPNQGFSRTNSLSGVTDSAAGGTALATGYKTVNKYVGKDKYGNDITSLTELAGAMGKATAVMSTEAATGATPSSFSAHALDRYDTDDIEATQAALKEKYGTVINCGYNDYDKAGVIRIQNGVQNTLRSLSKDEDGFFLMYEEAHIDKHCHNNDGMKAFEALVRFNQVIGVVMEYAFYNPDTFVLITADHETGGLTPVESGVFSFTSTNHTGADVPVFAYGAGSEYFNGVTVENIEIPKQIARLWGEEKFGQ